MRVIGTLNDEKKGFIFSSFLQQKKIAHQIEIEPVTDWGSSDYGTSRCKIWILEEEQVDEAVKWLNFYQLNPFDPLFNLEKPLSPYSAVPPPASPVSNRPLPSLSSPRAKTINWENQPLGWLTRFLIGICCLLLLFKEIVPLPFNVPQEASGLSLFASPVDNKLLYDYPQFFELLNRFIQVYGFEAINDPAKLPYEGNRLLKEIESTSVWKGFYSLITEGEFSLFMQGKLKTPLFEKIRQGEVWRLFTPVLVHGDLFHLFFNMIWLLVLGKQMEQRLRPGRYFLFILVVGILSNTAQYLMSGPNFVGFSGILCGMLAFIWVRQKDAPWEGYQIDRLTFLFMMIFIGGMGLLQLISFIMEVAFKIHLPLNIANTAHISGGLLGFLLGKLNYFSWRLPKNVG
ncbi:MAG: rhomboid family intramembrane serine protease [Candidatus Protochlamydia sp.]|nr:rhomboid family intramembrane serine protease [Candidatus Protochlamydia sp.]